MIFTVKNGDFGNVFEERIIIYGGGTAKIEGCTKLEDVKNECIKLWCNEKIIGIFGQNLMVDSFEMGEIKIKGKIKSTEYLT